MILLRFATEADLPLMLAWRSQEKVYQGFYTQREPLKWEEHIHWFKGRNQDWVTFIIIYETRPVGVVVIGQLDHWSPEIGYYVGEVSLWGKGIGKEAVKSALSWIKSGGKEYAHTTILDNNKRSISLIKSLGFKKFGKAREGESWYQRKL